MTGGARVLGMSPGAARIVLAASLAANFLVLGLAGGAALRMGGHDGHRFRLTQQVVEIAAPERKEAVAAALETNGRDGWREASRARWTAIAERLAARPFDAEAVSGALADSDARRAEGRAARNAAFVSAVSLLSDEERAALSEAILRRMEERERRD